jgi:hypothetical protein
MTITVAHNMNRCRPLVRHIRITHPYEWREDDIVHMEILGPSGTLREYVDLSMEDAWIIGDVLRQIAEDYEVRKL